MYLFYIILIIQQLNLRSKKPYITFYLLREPNRLRVFYRSLQILNENAMCFLGPCFVIIHAAFTIYFIFVQTVFIRSKLSFVVWVFLTVSYVGSFTFWMCVLQIGKSLWLQGNNNLDSWAKVGFNCGNHDRKIMAKFRKSCRLILIRHGNVLVFGRMTQFAYVKSLILYTCKLLIGLRKL